eukprot:TRINITY_DN43915_c0_g1_i2.p1 TRINITY_DN43915_c0_g1~~TRINITY_DN43915_c0_g1_i2.p1  ORF type:complete len:747 (+),score=218.41 TRINITY_DN43915_c0_g1_i2:149-2389(+)
MPAHGVDEQQLAFSLAANVLPGRLQAAINSQSIRKLNDAIDAASRTYKIYPEKEPAAVSALLARAQTLVRRKRGEVDKAIKDLIKETGCKSRDRLAQLQAVKKDFKSLPDDLIECIEQEISVLDKQALTRKMEVYHKEMAKALRLSGHASKASVNQALGKLGIQDKYKVFQKVIDSSKVYAVRTIAQKERDRMVAEAQILSRRNVSGCAAVEAVIKRLEQLIPAAVESEDVLQIEEVIQQANACKALAELRDGVDFPPSMQRHVAQAEKAQRKHEDDALDVLGKLLEALGSRESATARKRLVSKGHWVQADFDKGIREMQFLEAIAANMEGETTENNGRRMTALCELFGEDRLCNKFGWNQRESERMSNSVSTKMQRLLPRFPRAIDSPIGHKVESLSLLELKRFYEKHESEVEHALQEDAIRVFNKCSHDRSLNGSEQQKLEELIARIRANKVRDISNSGKNAKDLGMRVTALCNDRIQAIIAARYLDQLSAAIESNQQHLLREAIDAVGDHYGKAGAAEMPMSILSLKVKALMVLNKQLHENCDQSTHQHRHKPSQTVTCQNQPINLSLVNTMSYMKMKSYLVERGVPQDEVDKCPGKPTMLRLAATHKFTCDLQCAIDSGNPRQLEQAIDDMDRHYSGDTPPHCLAELREQAAQAKENRGSNGSGGGDGHDKKCLCGALFSVCTIGLSWIPYCLRSSRAEDSTEHSSTQGLHRTQTADGSSSVASQRSGESHSRIGTPQPVVI